MCHAATAATRTARFAGDDALEPAALDAIARRMPALPRHEACLTSPGRAAVQTAQALALDATVDPGLRDAGFGRWTGLTLQEVEGSEPEAIRTWLSDPEAAPHGGEATTALLGRVGTWLDARRDGPRRVLAITHAAVIRAAVVHALGAPPLVFWRIDVAPLARVGLVGGPGRWRLRALQPDAG